MWDTVIAFIEMVGMRIQDLLRPIARPFGIFLSVSFILIGLYSIVTGKHYDGEIPKTKSGRTWARIFGVWFIIAGVFGLITNWYNLI